MMEDYEYRISRVSQMVKDRDQYIKQRRHLCFLQSSAGIALFP